MDIIKSLKQRRSYYNINKELPVSEWAMQANGMLQISIWSGLRELNIGASLQHYNPIIDEAIRNLFHLPDSYKLIAQMPFGEIVEEPAPKEKETIGARVSIVTRLPE